MNRKLTYDELKQHLSHERNQLNTVDKLPNKYFTHDICLLLLSNFLSDDVYNKYLVNAPINSKYKKIALKYCKSNCDFINYVPKNFLTHSFYFKLLKNNLYTINYMPDKYITYSMALYLCKHDKEQIVNISRSYINNYCKSRKLLSYAVKANCDNFVYLPEYLTKSKKRTYDFFMSHVKYIFDFGVLPGGNISGKKINNLIVQVLSYNGFLLGQLYDNQKTKQMCLNAIKYNHENFKFISFKYRNNSNFVFEALQTNFKVFTEIENKFANYEFVLNNIKSLVDTPSLCKKFIRKIFSFVKQNQQFSHEFSGNFLFGLYNNYNIDVFNYKFIPENYINEVENLINGDLLLK